MTNRRHCVECDELVQDPSVPEEHKASCSHSRERLDSYARGRADERAAIVRWLRGCMRPDFARAAGIDVFKFFGTDQYIIARHEVHHP